MPGTALKTDRYELTMLEAALRSGAAGRRAVFEVFARNLPPGRRYGVLGGVGRLVDAISEYVFAGDELAWLIDGGIVSPATGHWLATHPFSGDVDSYAEGEPYFPYSPVLVVEAPFGEGVLLETLILSVLNHDSAVASAAARMVDAARGLPLWDMGSRRTDDDAAIHAARMAHLVGFAGTSNLAAGLAYGVPTVGTAAHAFTLVHDSEREAFRAQMEALGTGTTLLVDTYDAAKAIRIGIEVARDLGADGPGAIRLDSGDLAAEARAARALLDELGAGETRIIVSSDLDEYAIEELFAVEAPIDGFGVGTRLVTGSGHPTASFVYKLVAIECSDRPGEMRPVAKRSSEKVSRGGRKDAYRLLDVDGYACAELAVTAGSPRPAPPPGGKVRELHARVIDHGEKSATGTASETLDRHRRALKELRPLWRSTAAGGPALVATAQVEEGALR
jgi:nicotinate phosphoribosyltransferase